MVGADSDRLILRAEVRSGTDFVVASGLQLSAESVFVVTDWHAPVDTPVSVRLEL